MHFRDNYSINRVHFNIFGVITLINHGYFAIVANKDQKCTKMLVQKSLFGLNDGRQFAAQPNGVGEARRFD